MTVKSIQPRDKSLIAMWYSNGMNTKQELAEIFQTSTRTVERVLIEEGVIQAPTPRITPRIRAYMQVLAEHDLTPEQLDEVLTNHKYPYRAVQGYLHQCTAGQIAGMLYQRFLGKPKQPLLQLTSEQANAQTHH